MVDRACGHQQKKPVFCATIDSIVPHTHHRHREGGLVGCKHGLICRYLPKHLIQTKLPHPDKGGKGTGQRRDNRNIIEQNQFVSIPVPMLRCCVPASPARLPACIASAFVRSFVRLFRFVGRLEGHLSLGLSLGTVLYTVPWKTIRQPPAGKVRFALRAVLLLPSP